MRARAVIFGCEGPELAVDERRFFRHAAPWGFILFARNIVDPDQLRRLTDALRACVGRNAPVLIDQEGGRVARLRAPGWRDWAPARAECARLPDLGLRVRAMELRYRLIAAELRALGIDVNCAPVLDVLRAETHEVLADRCYSSDPAEVAAIGRGVAEGLLAGGVLPVIKHIPGQGLARLDSHLTLPAVETDARTLAAVDFAPFRALADLPMAMTAHVVYSALDPARPATLSAEVVGRIRSDIGFDGLLMTDDLSMRALEGPFATRTAQAIAAGCDVILHCNGCPGEMAQIAEAAPWLAGAAAARAERALAARGRAQDWDAAALAAELAQVRGRAAHA